MRVRVQLNKTRLDVLGSGMSAKVAGVVKGTADNAASLARQLVPVDTGVLRDSIESSGASVSISRIAAEVRANAPYAAYVEMGTVNAPSQPFFLPAVENVKPHFIRELAKVLG